MGADGPPERVIQADGRAKAYRPLPRADRTAALLDGLAAYDRGDYFLAHELLEPAWMGTDDLSERALIQGLIKVAAAEVHGVRGNPAGVTRNLEGARDRLRQAVGAGDGIDVEIDLEDLLLAIDRRLDAIDGRLEPTADPTTGPVAVHWRRR